MWRKRAAPRQHSARLCNQELTANCLLPILKGMPTVDNFGIAIASDVVHGVGASGFEPPTSWSRTRKRSDLSRRPGVTYVFSARSQMDKLDKYLLPASVITIGLLILCSEVNAEGLRGWFVTGGWQAARYRSCADIPPSARNDCWSEPLHPPPAEDGSFAAGLDRRSMAPTCSLH
jgi:hypothetical protein